MLSLSIVTLAQPGVALAQPDVIFALPDVALAHLDVAQPDVALPLCVAQPDTYMLGKAYMVILGGTVGYMLGTAGYMVGGTARYKVVVHVILV